MNINKLVRNKYSVGIGPERFDKEFEWLNDVYVPSPENIALHQWRTIRQNLKNRFAGSQDIVNQINADIRAPQIAEAGTQYLNMAMMEIEQAFNNFADNINQNEQSYPDMELTSRYDIWQTELSNLAQQITNIYTRLLNDQFLNNTDIAQLKALSIKIETMINDINNVLSSQDSKVWQIAIRNYWTGKISYRSMTQAKSLIGSVRGIMSGIKGSAGELLGKNWINSQLHINNVRTNGKVMAIQLGNILGDIYTAGGVKKLKKQLTTDIALFDLNSIADNIIISISIDGKQQDISLKEFLIKAERGDYNASKVILQDETYAEYMLAGVQAKMGQNQKIYNPGLRTKIALIQLQGLQAEALKTLDKVLKTDGRKKRNIQYVQEHEDYTALFNYSLASQITYLLGKDNAYILTREGLQYIPDYLENNNYYFHINDEYRLGTSKHKYQINYSSFA